MKKGKRVLALVLAFVLVIGVLPMTAFASTSSAVDGDSKDAPLASLKYDGKTYKPDSHKVIEILLPNNNGKAITIKTADIGSVKAASGYKIGNYDFEDATVKMDKDMDGASTKMTVEYTKTGDSKKYKTTYTLGFERDELKPAKFSGEISLDLDADSSGHTFKSSDFTKLYTQNDGAALKNIEIEGKSDVAEFKVGTAAYDGKKLTTTEMGKLKLVPKEAGSAWFTVYAYDSDGNNVEGDVTINVTVTKTAKLSKITKRMTQTETLTLGDLGIAAAFKKAAGTEMKSITFTELPEYGDIKIGSAAAKLKTSYTAAEFAKAKFTPSKSKVTKTVTDSFSYSAVDADGNTYTGTVDMRIVFDALDIDDIVVKMKVNGTLTFSALKIPTVFKEDTKLTFSYAYFTQPDEDEGELRYNYKSSSSKGSLVDEDEEFYSSASGSKKSVSNITFVPEKNYDETVYITYVAYDTKDEDPYEGRIRINFTGSDMGELGPYYVDSDDVLSFKDEDISGDINDEFADATDEKNYSYVKFTLPDSDEGVLRVGYKSESSQGTKLSASTKVYKTGTSGTLMSDIYFVPDEDFSGTCEIDFTVYGKEEELDGTLVIKVDESDYDLATLKYTIDKNTNFAFKTTDINSKFKKEADENFDYIIFKELPSTKKGTLYYDYDTKKAKGTKVEEDDDEFYRNEKGENLVSDLLFVPAKDATGKVDFVYWAYAGRHSYSGKITLNISDTKKEVNDLTYKIYNNQLLRMNSEDFSTNFKTISGEALSYIKLTLPDAKVGKFFYDYTSASKNGGVVFADDELYKTSKTDLKIDSVYFVPEIDYIGTVDIKYTAYDEDENEYSGKMTLSIMEPSSFKDVKTGDWFYNPVKWGVGRNIVKGTSETEFSPTQTCTWAHILTFIWRAEGSPEPTTKSAGDIKGDEWYGKAVLWAVDKGIAASTATKNNNNGGFMTACTRAQALQFIYKTKGSPSTSGLSNKFSDVSSSDSYYDAVLWGVNQGITNGTGKDKNGNPIFEPSVICTRGHIITFLYRAIERKDLQL